MGPQVREAGFTMVVLCAEEYQPPHLLLPWMGVPLRSDVPPFPGVETVYAPNDDNGRPPTRDQLRIAINAADRVAAALRAGGKVLVTCVQGRNRSGLVSAIALHKFLGISGLQAIAVVKRARPTALTNEGFCEVLHRVPANPQAAPLPRLPRLFYTRPV